MTDTILTVEAVQARARKAHAAGQSVDDCPFPWHSAARVTWLREYHRILNLARQLDANTPPWHGAPAGGARVDVAQVR